MKALEFYFDFVSPFSYFAQEQIDRLPVDVQVTFTPVLFAGLLNHWQQKGPAEIPSKRRYTYRHIQWLARRHGIPFKMPPAHPFNPLAALRLSIALGNDAEVVRKIFRFVWTTGRRPDDPQAWAELVALLSISDADARTAAPAVKQQLRRNGERALALGVFGVPTFVIDGELFWGFDALEFVADYLRDPHMLDNDEMRRLSALPVGVMRTL